MTKPPLISIGLSSGIYEPLLYPYLPSMSDSLDLYLGLSVVDV